MADLLKEAIIWCTQDEVNVLIMGLFVGYFGATLRKRSEERVVIENARAGLRAFMLHRDEITAKGAEA